MPIVNMPNGDPVNFPDDMPDEQIRGMIASKFPAAVKQTGFLDRVGANMQQRMQAVQNAPDALNKGISAARYAVGGVGDIAGAAIQTLTPEPVKQAAASAVKAVGALPTMGQSTFGDVGTAAMGAADTLAKKYPTAANIMGLGADVAAAVPVGAGAVKAAPFVAQGATAVAQKVAKAPAAVKGMLPKKPVLSKESVGVKQGASDLYKSSSADNLTIEPDHATSLVSGLDNLRPKDTLKAAVWEKSGAIDEINLIKDAASKGSISLDGAIDMRSRLNGLITKAFIAKDDVTAMHLQDVKEKLTDAMTSNKTAKWQQANHEFSKGATMQTIEEMATQASTKAQPSTSLDTVLNKFLTGRKSAGLRPNERKLLEDVVKDTETTRLKQAAGSRLVKYAAQAALSKFGASGQVAGYLLGHYGASMARDSAFAAKMNKLGKVYEAIHNREFNIEKTPDAPEPLRLTDQRRPRKEVALERYARSQRINELGSKRTAFSPDESLGVNLRGVPYPTGISPTPKTLPSPENMRPLEMLGSRSGGDFLPRPQSHAENLKANAARTRDTELGMTAGVRRNFSRVEVRKKLGPVFDKLEEAEKARVEAEVNKAWMGNKPLGDIVRDFHSTRKTQMSEAMIKAMRNKRK